MKVNIDRPIDKMFLRIIEKSIRTIQIQIMNSIISDSFKRNHLRAISREIGVSYMTAKRNILILCEKGMVRKCKNTTIRPCYYELTEIGNIIMDNIEKEKKRG